MSSIREQIAAWPLTSVDAAYYMDRLATATEALTAILAAQARGRIEIVSMFGDDAAELMADARAVLDALDKS